MLALPSERLWVTVYVDDDEAAEVWLKEIGVDPERFSRIPGDDNFWAMGDTGPCGPCSEIFYDHGPEVPGGPPGTAEAEGDRYVEIWNLVFMQYERAKDGTLSPLPKPSVDTGMGLERVAAVCQGVHSNYEIDLFRNLIEAVREVTGEPERDNASLRVIADHIRSTAFLIVDGVLPSNEGRGYVLRRIIRRAVRHGYKLGVEGPFFHRLVDALVGEMGEAYPELARQRDTVERILRQEEERFAQTLDQGMRILDEAIAGLPEGGSIPGETVFKLYDTYGFPVDLTADIARERGLVIDMESFEREMAKQRERGRAASRFGADYTGALEVDVETTFTGYEALAHDAEVVALASGDRQVEALESGAEGVVVLSRTPFYAESGGQVGDSGWLRGAEVEFEVRDTQKEGGVHAHIGVVRRGTLRVGDTVRAEVDAERRAATVLNHSATHLLHAALREVLGAHVQQKGSLVAPDRLRFDFSHPQPLTRAELETIERRVNDCVRANAEASARVMPYDEAMRAGALAFFGEKYGEEVRVLSIGDISTELCGGTHVRRSGDIGLFKIIDEVGVAAGIRRIEAVTGPRAVEWVEDEEERLARIASLLKGGREDVDERVAQLVDRNRKLEKELERLQAKLASSAGTDLASQAVDVNGLKVLAARVEAADPKALRETVDQLKNKLGSAAVVLGAVDDGKVRLVAGVTKDRADEIPAGELVNAVAERVGGRGGGRPDMAQAGGNDPAALDAALRAVPEWVRAHLAKASL